MTEKSAGKLQFDNSVYYKGMENDDKGLPPTSTRVNDDLVIDLSLTIPPSEVSPGRTKDPTATLAAISARLATVVPPAESEITRINREVLAALNAKKQTLRANNDQLKQDFVVQGMEKDKVQNEKLGLQEQVEKAQEEIERLEELKAQVDKDLIENQRKQSHLEARLQTMKEEFDIEVETCMRAQDKLRIERLLNQKMELEALVEAGKLDQALDAELQHNKRVYSTGQQAFLHSERIAEQLRQHTQELEKNYEKAKKNVMTLKERFKMYETSAKEQITKLEVEVKVANAQLREITYVNKDNVAQIDQLRKSLTLSEKETMVLKTRVEESQKHVEELQSERKNLERNQTELDVAKSTSKNTLNRFILALQNMLALVKMDEFPLDEAIRELLQLVQDTFGDELQLDHILDEDDQPVEIELQVHEDITDEERMSRQRRAAARRKGIINIENMDDEEESSETTEREVIRMSRCRKSKLDHLVNKLQREIAQKSEFIADLESVVVEQNRTISQLSTTTKQQTRVIFQFECQKGMLESDLETTTLMLFKARAEKQTVEFTLEQVRIDLVLQTNRAFQTEVTLATLRREFDMQGIVYEDLLATIWRHDEDGPALSPSRLAAAVSGFNREQLSLQEAAWESQAFSEDGNKQDDTRTGTEIDGELATPDQLSSFTPAMLYPILPNQ
eukprot:jgi/Phyca11/531755/estExt2_fgenesh1_pg.C_PHYCAscaffold_20123